MPDFTSSLYLGFRHGAVSLRPWSQLTTGAPAALVLPPVAGRLQQRIAQLVGCERAVVGRSTLQLFWDLFGMFAAEDTHIFYDVGSYPIARWGVERAAGRGVAVNGFAHRSPAALAGALEAHDSGRRPVVVVDGLCHTCGCRTPIAAYHALTRAASGLLVVDDTQALGIVGSEPGSHAPYGHGGGGSLRFARIGGPDILVIGSLAKAFGAPLAALCGSRLRLRRFRAQSETRLHCSPPSTVAVRAAQRALQLNALHGEALRGRLARRIAAFRQQLTALGLSLIGGSFPVQTLATPRGKKARALHRQLLADGVHSVLRSDHDGAERLTFIITARHRYAELDTAAASLAKALELVMGRAPASLAPANP